MTRTPRRTAPIRPAPIDPAPISTVLLVMTVALLSGGCASEVPGVASPTSHAAGAAAPVAAAPTGDPGVAWVDKVCGTVLPAVKSLADHPAVNAGGDPKTAVAGLDTYLDQTGAVVSGATTGLGTVGPSPLTGGDAMVTALTNGLTKAGNALKQAKTNVTTLNTADPKTLGTRLPQAIAPLTELTNLPDPNAAMQGNPTLSQAAAKAPQCRQISTITG